MRRVALCAALVLANITAGTAGAEAQTYDPQGQKLVGRIHDANRAGQQRLDQSLGDGIDTARARYAAAKKQIQTRPASPTPWRRRS
ncbi:hypothetical protein [Reyranella sp.]|uniref:hypothetical protein n=1 Tax=Reyranella sp. TaxID=1929291 RepID=UPI003BACFE29